MNSLHVKKHDKATLSPPLPPPPTADYTAVICEQANVFILSIYLSGVDTAKGLRNPSDEIMQAFKVFYSKCVHASTVRPMEDCGPVSHKESRVSEWVSDAALNKTAPLFLCSFVSKAAERKVLQVETITERASWQVSYIFSVRHACETVHKKMTHF